MRESKWVSNDTELAVLFTEYDLVPMNRNEGHAAARLLFALKLFALKLTRDTLTRDTTRRGECFYKQPCGVVSESMDVISGMSVHVLSCRA